MFKVLINNIESVFNTLREAMDYAQKESYFNACNAAVITPDGRTVYVKV
jgi:hypothetical protein